MKHYITTSEAAIILDTLQKVQKAADKSPTMAAAIDIDRHDLAKCEAVIKKLRKRNDI